MEKCTPMAIARFVTSAPARLAAAAATVLACSGVAWTQPYPARTVRIVVAFPPGGGADVLARALAQKLTPALGQTVIVENRVGASGILGTDHVAKSAPDGYTLLLASTTQAIVSKLFAKVPFDLARDFVPVAFVGTAPLVLVVHPSLPVRSVSGLLALARSHPGQINYASAATGTVGHLSMELLKTMTRVNLVHVPYKGTAPAIVDLVGGHVQAMFDILPSSMPHIRTGRLRALAVTGTTRSPDAPDVPTVAESGLPGYEVRNWYGVLAPVRTPPEVVARLHGEIGRSIDSPDLRERLMAQGYTAEPIGNERFATMLSADLAKWARVIQDSGARAD